MDVWHFAAALLSALLHASWNAAVKASVAPQEAMTAQMVAAGVLALPLLLWAGLPPWSTWPWVLLTVLLSVASVLALLQGYRSGGFGSVYPVARATSVFGVAALAPLVMGERLGLLALGGVALIAVALLVLAWDTWRGGGAGPATSAAAPGAPAHAPPGAAPTPGRGLLWTLLAGLATAAYVLADARGVRATAAALEPGSSLRAVLSYGATISIANALVMGWLSRRQGRPLALVRRHARLAAPAALASTTSYLLILWVYQHAPVAMAAALRDTSALFALLIAMAVLKEPMPPRRLLAIGLALAALPLLRLG